MGRRAVKEREVVTVQAEVPQQVQPVKAPEISLHDLVITLAHYLMGKKPKKWLRYNELGLRVIEVKSAEVGAKQNPPIKGVSRSGIKRWLTGESIDPRRGSLEKLWLILEDIYQNEGDLFYPDTEIPIHFDRFADFMHMIDIDHESRKSLRFDSQKKAFTVMEQPQEEKPLTLKDIIVYTLQQNGWEFEPQELDIEANLSPGTTLGVLKRGYQPTEREMTRYARVLKDPNNQGALFPGVETLIYISKLQAENGEPQA